MADNEFKIALGVELDSNISTSINNQINKIKVKPIQIAIDPQIQDQLNAIQKQVQQSGASAGSNFAKSFNTGLDSINTTANNAANTIRHMQETLKRMKFDSSSIDIITKDLESMSLSIGKVTTKINGKNLNVSIKGIDEIGRAVTIIKQFDYSTGNISSVGKTISQTFDTSADAAKRFQKEVNHAYRELLDKQKEMASIRFELNNLDSEKDAKQIDFLIDRLEKLDLEYNDLYNTWGKHLDKNQFENLSKAAEQTNAKIDKLNAKAEDDSSWKQQQLAIKQTEDAYNELINIIKEMGSIQVKLIGLDNEKNTNEINALKSRLVELGNEYQKLDSVFSKSFNQDQIIGLDDAWDDLINRINVVDAKIADTSAEKQRKESVNQIKNAYDELINKIKEMGSIRAVLAKLDPNKDIEKIDVLTSKLNQLQAEFDEIYSVSGKSFTAEQLNGLSKALNETFDKIDFVEAGISDSLAKKAKQLQDKIQKAKTELALKVEDKFSVGDFDDDDSKIHDTFNKIKNKTKDAIDATKEFEIALKQLKSAIATEDVDSIVSSYARYENALKRVNNYLDINKRTDTSATKQVGEELEKIINVAERMKNLKIKIEMLDEKSDANKIAELTSQLKELESTYFELVSQFDFSNPNIPTGGVEKLDQVLLDTKNKIAEIKREIQDTKAKLAEKIKLNINNDELEKNDSKVITGLKNIENQSDELTKAIKEYKLALEAVKIAQKSTDPNNLINAWNNYENALKKVNNQLVINANAQEILDDAQKKLLAEQRLKTDKADFGLSIEIWAKKNTAALKQFGNKIEDIKAQIESADDVKLKKLKGEWKAVQKEAILAGKVGMTFDDRLKVQFAKYASYFSIASVFHSAEQVLRVMYDDVVAIDSAMTDLLKVTDETDVAYDRFLTNAGQKAQGLGRSVSSFIQQSANWAKMGFDTVESAQLAEISSIYANVADVDDDTAVSDMVTAMKAFNIEAKNAISIIDPMNKLSNEFAVTAAGLGEGLSRSASTMATAGTDLEHTLALLTGISEITQSPEEAGNFLKTAIARIQGMKGELEELGEEVDESVDSISKVQTQILNLTSGTSKAVNIFDDNGEFRDYYYIMQDIASIVDELESTDRAQLYEILFGKNRMNQGAAMIQAFKSGQIGKALDAAFDSDGSAMAEQEKWMESLEAKLGKLEAAFESLSQTVLDSDFLGILIDLFTDVINVLDFAIDKIGILNIAIAGVGIGKFTKQLLNTAKTLQSVKSVSTLTNAITLLSTAFPNVARGIGVFTTALSSGAKGVDLLKAAVSGLWTVITAHPIIAAIAAITALGVGIYNLTKREKELSEKVEEVTSAYNEQRKTLKDNKSTFESLKSEYEELSKGVDDLGGNLSLTEEEFGRYNDVTNQIADMFPILIQGYTDTGNAILTCKDNVEELTEAYKEQIIAANNIILGGASDVFEDFKNAKKEFEESNSKGNELTVDGKEALKNILNSDDLDAAINEYAATGTTAMVQIVQALKDSGLKQNEGTIYKFWTDAESGHDFIKRCIQENKTIVDAIVGNFDAQIEEKVKNVRSLAEAYIENTLLSDDYSDMSMTMHSIVNSIVAQMDYDTISQFDSLQDLYDYLKTLLNDFKSLDDNVEEKIEVYVDVKAKFNNKDVTTGEYIQVINDVKNAISGLDENTQKSIIVSLGLEDADNTLEQYNALIQGLKNRGISADVATEFANSLNVSDFSVAVEMTPYFSKEYIEAEFERLQEGGSVNLALRPTIDASVLEDAGWKDVGEGAATVFTNTFSNKAEDIAMNFTPIITDENGNYVGVLSPNELQSYAEEVIAGTREDDLGLQIGAKFEGKNAIAEAEAIAEYIHKLQDFYYIDASNYDVSDLITELEEYSKVSQTIEPISFSKLIADSSENDDEFIDRVNTYVEKVGTLQDAIEKIREGKFTDEDHVKLIEEFDSLAVSTDDLDVAIVELLKTMNTDMLSDFLSQFGNLETEEDVEALRNFMKATLKLGDVVGNTQFSIDVSTESEGIEALQAAIKESVSSTGLSAESIKALKSRYKDLEDYDPARLFEETTNGIHLNTEALNELEDAYEEQTKTKLKDTLNTLKSQYNDLADEIKTCDDTVRQAELYAKQKDIVNQINEVATLASQYDGLTSAYHKWENAQSNGNERDMYSGIIAGKEELEEEMSRGWLDEDSLAYLELLTGKNMSTLSVEEQIAAYKKLSETVSKAGYDVWDFFTFDKDGNETSQGVYNFFDSIIAKQKELKEAGKWDYDDAVWATKDEKGNYTFDFSVAGGDKAVAEALGISEELVQIVLRAAKDAQFVVNLESARTEFADLKTSAEEANEALINAGKTKIDFNFDTTDSDKLNENIDDAKALLNSLSEENADVNIGFNDEDYQNAKIILTTLISQKQQLSTPAIMSVTINSEQAETELEKTIIALQNYHTNANAFELNAAVGADTTEAQTNIQTALKDVSPEVLVQLGISEEENTEFYTALSNLQAGATVTQESIDLIKETIAKIDPPMMVKAGLDASLIEGYTYDRNAMITYSYNKSEVNSWNFDKTATIHYKETGFSAVARVNGTAYAQGNWGNEKTERALTGELGRELVVYKNRYWTVGDNGAEFATIPKGAIVFNHKQTEQLLKNGKITSRGRAFAEGTAYDYGSNGDGITIGTISGSVKKKGSSSDKSGSGSDEFKETFDWIEVAIDRIERAISRLDTKVNSTYRSWSSRNDNLKKEISKVGEEIDLQQRGYDRYIQQANSVGLDESWVKKVRDGKVDIETITDEELAEKIGEYQTWYEKALDCNDAILELKETQAELYETAFNHIVTQYEGFLSVIEHERNMLEEYISQSEASGRIVSTKYYDALINVEKANIDKLEKEKEALLTSLEEAVNSGTIKPDSEAWYFIMPLYLVTGGGILFNC